MKKIKLTIMSLAILLSIGGAFATSYHQDCRYAQQYIPSGGGYIPVGEVGTTYACMGTLGVCTYYQVAGGYAVCQTGAYTPFFPGLGKESIGKTARTNAKK